MTILQQEDGITKLSEGVLYFFLGFNNSDELENRRKIHNNLCKILRAPHQKLMDEERLKACLEAGEN
ncbi:hypothetical protein LWI28_011265 [Acer negundo]|uniref:Uncharacterized protein n=1 Tax=Acer negundo TaxID=4023 RepID=A0AAD5IDD5_ACENE|nr:hypothetical protein LWI28_011265 [Acer negundo]